jgi:hypothetical protein
MLPLSDGIPARRFPIVNALLIVANFAAFIFYELPHLNTAVYHASFYPCSVDGACRAPEPWASAGSPPCSATGEARRPSRRCASASDRVWSVLS